MTVREMHIEVEQATQQVAANRGRKWLPEEIDWVLSKMQDRYIASCLRPRQDGSGGFELDQAGADKIRMLVVRNPTLVPYIDTTERYKCFLPPDYMYLLGDWSNTIDLCDGAITATTVSSTLFITRILQNLSTLTSPPYYATVTLHMPDVSIIVPTDLPLGHAHLGYQEKADRSFITPWLLHKAKTLYWESFDDLYYPSNFIAVKTAAFVGAVDIITDGITNTTETVTTKIVTYHTGTGKRHNNRLSSSAVISSLNESAYWKSRHYSPLSELERGNLYIYRDDSFIVTNVGISYIRKPQPISLSLGSDCELAGEATHQAICDLATEYLKGTVQNVEGKQLKTADITERVIL